MQTATAPGLLAAQLARIADRMGWVRPATETIARYSEDRLRAWLRAASVVSERQAKGGCLCFTLFSAWRDFADKLGEGDTPVLRDRDDYAGPPIKGHPGQQADMLGRIDRTVSMASVAARAVSADARRIVAAMLREGACPTPRLAHAVGRDHYTHKLRHAIEECRRAGIQIQRERPTSRSEYVWSIAGPIPDGFPIAEDQPELVLFEVGSARRSMPPRDRPRCAGQRARGDQMLLFA